MYVLLGLSAAWLIFILFVRPAIRDMRAHQDRKVPRIDHNPDNVVIIFNV